MPLIQKLKGFFEEITKGNYSARDPFFETIWVNFTNLAHNTEVNPLFHQIEQWAYANEKEHPDFLARFNLTMGGIEFLGDNYDRAQTYLNKAHETFSALKDEDGLAATSLSMGFNYRGIGELDMALKYGLPGMTRLEHSGGFKMFLIIGYYWIGGIYTDTGHCDEALDLFRKGLEVDFPAGLENMDARLTNGIAGVYMKQKKYSLALEYYLKALDRCETTTERTFKARGLTDLGDYYLKMGNYPEAIRYNEEALAIRRQMKIQNGEITNLMNLGDIYYKQGKSSKAIEVLSQALKLAEEIRVKTKMYQIHHLLSDIYLGTGNITESLAHHKAFHEIREEVNHDDLDRKVKNQVQLFQAQQTQNENAIIKAQKQEIENKNIELQETIDELTLAKISKKAKALTLGIALVLFVFQEQIVEVVLHLFKSENRLLSLAIKIVIIFSLEPLNKTIEHYLLRKVIKKKKKEVLV